MYLFLIEESKAEESVEKGVIVIEDKDKNIPMRVVKEKTGLSSRQIRYYDEVDLIFPARSSGNQRRFSEKDINRLNKIKQLIEDGYNIDSIKEKLSVPRPVKGDKQKNKYFLVMNKDKENKLSSLYPVSNRSYLTRVLQKNKR